MFWDFGGFGNRAEINTSREHPLAGKKDPKHVVISQPRVTAFQHTGRDRAFRFRVLDSRGYPGRYFGRSVVVGGPRIDRVAWISVPA
jgi:hypothetical protein